MNDKVPISNSPAAGADTDPVAFPKDAEPWTETEGVCGMKIITLSSWRHFAKLLYTKFSKTQHYIWRGQRDTNWTLQSTFDRLLKKMGKDALLNEDRLERHLSNFRDAMLGRRGPNPTDLDPDEVWALGQHNGLATPLLDWTRSPFVAAYFAFCDLGNPPSERCAVFALNQQIVFRSQHPEPESDLGIPPIPLKIFRPATDDNSRLINQAGLFTKITKKPAEASIEDCLRKTLKPRGPNVLYKITIPNNDHDTVLRSLNCMNINHATLFPDLYGAAKFTNAQFEIDG